MNQFLLDRVASKLWSTEEGLYVEDWQNALWIATASQVQGNPRDSNWVCVLLVMEKSKEGYSSSLDLDGYTFLVESLHSGKTLSTPIIGGVALVSGLTQDIFCNARIVPDNKKLINLRPVIQKHLNTEISLPYSGNEELIEPGHFFCLVTDSPARNVRGIATGKHHLRIDGFLHTGTYLDGEVTSTLRSKSGNVNVLGVISWEGKNFIIEFHNLPSGSYDLVTEIV